MVVRFATETLRLTGSGTTTLLRRSLVRAGARSATPHADSAVSHGTDNLVWLGGTLVSEGRLDDAQSTLLAARREFEALGLERHSLTATIDYALAGLFVARDKLDQTERLYRQVASTFESSRTSFLGGYASRACPLDGLMPSRLHS